MYRLLFISMLLIFASSLFADDMTETDAAEPQNPAESEQAQDEQNAVYALCQSYAQEEKINAKQKKAYIQDCLTSMTDLNNALVLDAPLIDDSEKLSDQHTDATNGDPIQAETPESLVTTEIVTTPDPQAEQLDTN